MVILKNIVEFVNCDFKEPYKSETIRVLGIFVIPVGCVVGFIDIEDGGKDNGYTKSN